MRAWMQRFGNSGKRMRAAVAGGIAALLLAGFTAHAGIASLAPDVPPPAVSAPRVPAPTIARLPVLDAAAPAPGTTGTAPLPELPIAAANVPATAAAIPAAPPFRLRGTMVDHSRALQCLTTAIYYEAASEPEDGQRAVAQVVLNRVRHPAFPASVCGVVFQGSNKRVCQFSFACDGAMARVPMRSAWDRAQRVAAAALYGSVFAPVGLATHYHTYAVTPSWNRSLVMTGVHGAHFFHRWKGYWGTPMGFRDRYFGNEPTPGPLRKLDGEAPTATVAAAAIVSESVPVAAIASAPPVVTPVSQVQAAYADSGTAVAAPPSADSQILDRWKDSGQPIR